MYFLACHACITVLSGYLMVLIFRWQRRKRCARTEQSLLFDLFKAFDKMQSQIGLSYHNRSIFRAQHVLIYHFIKVPWDSYIDIDLYKAGRIFYIPATC